MQMTVANRLFLMLAISLAGILVVGSIGLVQMSHLKNELDRVQSRLSPATEAGSQFALSFADVRRASVLYTSAPSDEVRALAKKQLDDSAANMRKRFAELQDKAIGLPEEKAFLERESAVVKRYMDLTDDLIARMNAPGAEAEAIMSQAPKILGPVGIELLDEIDKHRKLYSEHMAKSAEDSHQRYGTALWIIIASALIGVVLLAVLGVHLIREIRSRLTRLSAYMDHVSSNLDFTDHIRVTQADEIGKTADSFNKLVARLRENLARLASNADSVNSAASEMSRTSDRIAAAAYQQSEASASMAATLEEISVSINHVADRAGETDAIVGKVGQLAENGECSVRDVTLDVQEIAGTVEKASAELVGLERHSVEIAKIVQVIKEVAEQTNLLALNAAIEAARAGESGRGFAVVADEVRKLAERTALSTSEIDKTVDSMRNSAISAVSDMQVVVKRVSAGVERARCAAADITAIGLSCRDAIEMVGSIAQSIREQGTAANSIAVQIERIAQMSDENKAGTEQSAKIASGLESVARDMQDIVVAYKLEEKRSSRAF